MTSSRKTHLSLSHSYVTWYIFHMAYNNFVCYIHRDTCCQKTTKENVSQPFRDRQFVTADSFRKQRNVSVQSISCSGRFFTMDRSRFDEMIKKLMTKCRSRVSRDNAVTVASKLLEISYAMGDIEREVEECRSVIIENLRRHMSMVTLVGRLRLNCDELADFGAELRAFEENARPRIAGIEEARRAFLDELRGADENEENEAEREKQLRGIIRELIDERENIVAEINTVEQRVAVLVAEIDDSTTLINFKNKENADFYERTEREHCDLLRRRHELAAKLTELSASRN